MTAIEFIKMSLAENINRLNKSNTEYVAKASEDYIQYFTWYAEEHLKSNFLFREYNRFDLYLKNGVRTEGDIMEVLIKRIDDLTDDLFNRRLIERSTNQLTNYAYSVELEAKQEIIKCYRQYVRYINAHK